MAKRTAKERREALGAWLDQVERQVKARLRKLKLPDDIDGLREHLSSPPGVRRVDPKKHLGAITDVGIAAEKVGEAIANSPSWQQAYDLFTCLACLPRCRELLKRREPEGIVMQAYVLGARAQIAGLRPDRTIGKKVRQGGSEGGTARWGGKKAIAQRHQQWQRRLDELHRKSPGLSWTRLANRVAEQMQKLGQPVTGRNIRRYCTNPRKETGT